MTFYAQIDTNTNPEELMHSIASRSNHPVRKVLHQAPTYKPDAFNKRCGESEVSDLMLAVLKGQDFVSLLREPTVPTKCQWNSAGRNSFDTGSTKSGLSADEKAQALDYPTFRGVLNGDIKAWEAFFECTTARPELSRTIFRGMSLN